MFIILNHICPNNSKYQVVLSDFSDTNLPTVIYSRGWESLCGAPVMCLSMIIQEFYSNMHGFDYSIPQFVTCVQGIRMVVTPSIVSEVLHVLKVAHPDYLAVSICRQCPKTNSCLYSMRHHLLGVIVKTPHAQPLLKVRES